jgi:hypothetical protein
VSANRRARELSVSSLPECTAELKEPIDNEALRLLDKEVGALPDHLRAVVVLCELDGLSRKVVAARLKIPEGTLSSRLAKARKLLAERLLKRGVVLPVTALGSLGLTATPVPAKLITLTSAFASTTTLPPLVASLANGVLRTMFLNKLKTEIPLAAIAAGLLACVAFAVESSPTAPSSPHVPRPTPVLMAAPHTDPPSAKVESKPLPKGPNKLILVRNGRLSLIDPDGKNETKIDEKLGKFQWDIKLAPDGKSVAMLVREDVVAGAPMPPSSSLHVRGIDEKEPAIDLGVKCKTFSWSGDGTEIVCSEFEDDDDKLPEAKHFIINAKTKAKEALKLPKGHIINDWSRDGKFFLTTFLPGKEIRLYLINRDGTVNKALTDDKQFAINGRLSPDAKRVLFMDTTLTIDSKDKPDELKLDLAVLDVATGKVTKVQDVPVNGELQEGYCWSPDGMKITYVWRELHKGTTEERQSKETESRLVVCDFDGKNAKASVTEKGAGQWLVTISGVDWR